MQHPPGVAGRGHVDGGQGGGTRHPAVAHVPLLPRGAGDGAAHFVGLLALGIGSPDMDAVGAAGGQGTAGAGASGGLAGVLEGHRPTTAGTSGGRRERPGGAVVVQAVWHVPRNAVGQPCGGGGSEAGGDAASTVFGRARLRGPDLRQRYSLGQLADGPLCRAQARDPLQLPQGPLAGWPWERGFAEAVVSWGSALHWAPCSGHLRRAGPGLRVPQ